MKFDKKNRVLSYLFFAFYFILSNSSIIFPQKIFNLPLSNRIASYDMTVKLNPVKKTVTGMETLYWKNTSPDKISELRFHLYLMLLKIQIQLSSVN